MTKPFGVNELLARIRAHLRRASEPETYSFGDVELNFRTHDAKKAGRPVELSAREFEILKYFVARRGETITRDQLLDGVWGASYPFSRTVDNHIAKLRQKIETDPAAPRFIVTLHRVGYKFLG